VTAQFYGHTHNDEFAVFYEGERATNVAFVTPSITTYTGTAGLIRAGQGSNPRHYQPSVIPRERRTTVASGEYS